MLTLLLKGGWLMIPIVGCSVIALALALGKYVQFRAVLRSLAVEGRDPASIPPLAPLARAIAAGRSDKELSLLGTRQVLRLEKGLRPLSLIGVICPLLGLTGTVLGMIEAFQALAAAGGAADPGLLAGGIWQALLTTAAGLLVAIPAHVAYHLLDGQLDEITHTLKETAAALVARREVRDGI